jgi:hypothetical protein
MVDTTAGGQEFIDAPIPLHVDHARDVVVVSVARKPRALSYRDAHARQALLQLAATRLEQDHLYAFTDDRDVPRYHCQQLAEHIAGLIADGT